MMHEFLKERKNVSRRTLTLMADNICGEDRASVRGTTGVFPNGAQEFPVW